MYKPVLSLAVAVAVAGGDVEAGVVIDTDVSAFDLYANASAWNIFNSGGYDQNLVEQRVIDSGIDGATASATATGGGLTGSSDVTGRASYATPGGVTLRSTGRSQISGSNASRRAAASHVSTFRLRFSADEAGSLFIDGARRASGFSTLSARLFRI